MSPHTPIRVVTTGCVAVATTLAAAAGIFAESQVPAEPGTLATKVAALEERLESLSYAVDAMTKKVDDLLWFQRVGDVAEGEADLAPQCGVRLRGGVGALDPRRCDRVVGQHGEAGLAQ